MSFLHSAMTSLPGRGAFFALSAGCAYQTIRAVDYWVKGNSPLTLFQKCVTLYSGKAQSKDTETKRQAAEIAYWASSALLYASVAFAMTSKPSEPLKDKPSVLSLSPLLTQGQEIQAYLKNSLQGAVDSFINLPIVQWVQNHPKLVGSVLGISALIKQYISRPQRSSNLALTLSAHVLTSASLPTFDSSGTSASKNELPGVVMGPSSEGVYQQLRRELNPYISEVRKRESAWQGFQNFMEALKRGSEENYSAPFFTFFTPEQIQVLDFAALRAGVKLVCEGIEVWMKLTESSTLEFSRMKPVLALKDREEEQECIQPSNPEFALTAPTSLTRFPAAYYPHYKPPRDVRIRFSYNEFLSRYPDGSELTLAELREGVLKETPHGLFRIQGNPFSGPIEVNRIAENNFQVFVEDLIAAGATETMTLPLLTILTPEQIERLDTAQLRAGIEVDHNGRSVFLRLIEANMVEISLTKPALALEDALSIDEEEAVQASCQPEEGFKTPVTRVRCLSADSDLSLSSLSPVPLPSYKGVSTEVALALAVLLDVEFTEEGEEVETLDEMIALELTEKITIKDGSIFLPTTSGGEIPFEEALGGSDLEPHITTLKQIWTGEKERGEKVLAKKVKNENWFSYLAQNGAEMSKQDALEIIAEVEKEEKSTQIKDSLSVSKLVGEKRAQIESLEGDKQEGKRYILTLHTMEGEVYIPLTPEQTFFIDRLRKEREGEQTPKAAAAQSSSLVESEFEKNNPELDRSQSPCPGPSLGDELLLAMGSRANPFDRVDEMSGGHVFVRQEGGSPVSLDLGDIFGRSSWGSPYLRKKLGMRFDSRSSSPATKLFNSPGGD